MKTTITKGIYEAPRAEVSIVLTGDILTDSNGTEIDWTRSSF